MKRFLFCLMAMVAIVGCTEAYDDTDIRTEINDLKGRVTALEKMCKEMNTNIASLQTIVGALQTNDYITNVSPIVQNGKTIGYTISFAKAQPITIYHGTDGKDGQDGQDGADGEDGKDSSYVPQIGVKQDVDGIYYWTLDGEWLLDENGNKVKAVGTDGKDGENGKDGVDGEDGKDGENGQDGKDGITPQLKIENDYWYISYDNGQTWTMLGKATGEDGQDGADGKDGESFFQSVTQDEHNVYFTLADGTVITVPKGTSLNITFAESDLVVMSPNSTREISYTVTSATETVTVEVTSSADVKAKVIADDDSGLTGKIRLTTGATIDEYSKVIVFVSNDEKVIMRSITFEEAGLVVEENTTKIVAAEGGNVTLEFLSNVSYEVVIPEDAQSWISVVPATRAMEKHTVVLELEPNDGELRSADVTVKSTEGNLSLTYTIEQEPNLDYQLALERQALIDLYNATDGDNWINNTNWCSDKPVSEWFGVYCTYNGCVSSISLSNNNLRGALPSTIGTFSYLDGLYLYNNDIYSVPKEIGLLKKLYYLHLMTDEIEVSDNSFDFPSLTHLMLSIKNIKTNEQLPSFQSLKSLTSFHLHVFDKLGIPNENIKIPSEIIELQNLEELILNGFGGEIPSQIGLLSKLRTLRIHGAVTGHIPSSIGDIVGLEYLSLSNNNLVGNIPASICLLPNLYLFDVSENNLSGSIPAELSNLMTTTRISGYTTPFLNLQYNQFSGEIPEPIYNHPKWKVRWPAIILDNCFDINTLLTNGTPIQGPQFEGVDIYGVEVSSEQVYKENEYTLIYDYAYVLGAPHYITNSLAYVKDLYRKYGKNGLKIIMFTRGDDNADIEQFMQKHNIPWTCCNISLSTTSSNRLVVENGDMQFYPTNLWGAGLITIFDSDGMMVAANPGIYDENVITQFLSTHLIADEIDYYTSTDYSQDGVVTTLQTATKGEGIDLVLMGDAYSDRQIADGTYQADMENLYNNLFAEEPYKSFKDHFNVHYVNVVSATEGYDYGNTALSGYFGNGTLVGGDDGAAFNYALKAISEEEMDEALLIVAMNSDNYAGTCYMYYPQTSLGYGNGVSVAYFPKGGDQTTFAQLLHHEACGHGFAKLADEYAYESMGAVPNDYVSQIQTQQTDWGWWKNVDFTSDVTAVRWAKFISDSRYANEKLGAYEGAMTYWTGVWRPTENSIMRYNTGGFNAPSREAIYYRIHKLAYGDEWTYDYETFVKYDEINRTTTTTTQSAGRPMIYKPTAPPVVMQKNWRDELR